MNDPISFLYRFDNNQQQWEEEAAETRLDVQRRLITGPLVVTEEK